MTWAAWLLLAAAVVWNLVRLRALTIGVPYLNDSSMHEQMVRFATAQLRSGQLPLMSWFPYLGEGSPQFLHYQSLPAILTGAIGLLTGPDAAFRWSLYLLLSLWPISVFLSARAFGAGRGAAGAAAAMAPFVVSATGVGYEQHAYVWSGYGVWTQLWAMWTLPLAWGYSWRAIREGRGYLRAVLCTALTAALHFETGYLALSVLLVWPWVAGRPLAVRLRRAVLVFAGALVASAWVIVPLLAQRHWAAVNEALQGTGLVDGYGAHRVLLWLLRGQLLDHGRLPVLSVCAGIGFGLAWLGFPSDRDGRALLVAFGVCLLLSFGPTTFGSLVDVIPGHADLFFRRFMMGTQLAALLLAGRGAAWAGRRGVAQWERGPGHRAATLSPVLVCGAAVLVLAPAWLQLGASDRRDAAAIASQRRADHTQGAQLARLASLIRHDGGGRTYAGMPSNWGAAFTIGAVPVFKYLESLDIDEVGYTLRTASLMTDPEYFFDERNLSDYRLFGIRYLILPTGKSPPVRATLTRRAGPYTLWTIPHARYLLAGQIVGSLPGNRTNIGVRSVPLQRSQLAAHGEYLSVNYGSHAAPARPLPHPVRRPAAGQVIAQNVNLSNGAAEATVRMRRPGVVVLSASFDPGWTVRVNGHRRATRMIAPALVGAEVPAGTDRVVFRYHGDRWYPELFLLSGLALLITGLGAPAIRRARRQRTRTC